MDVRVDRWVYGWTDEWFGAQVDVQTDQWLSTLMDGIRQPYHIYDELRVHYTSGQ